MRLDDDRIIKEVRKVQNKILNWEKATEVEVKIVGTGSASSAKQNRYSKPPQTDGIDNSVWKFKSLMGDDRRRDRRSVYTVKVKLKGLPKPKFVPSTPPPPVPRPAPEQSVPQPVLEPRPKHRAKLTKPVEYRREQLERLLCLVESLPNMQAEADEISELRVAFRTRFERLDLLLSQLEDGARGRHEDVLDDISRLTEPVRS